MMDNCEIKYQPIQNVCSTDKLDDYGNIVEDEIVIYHQLTCFQRFCYCIKRFFRKLFRSRRYRKK
jgi:hypothetical protein